MSTETRFVVIFKATLVSDDPRYSETAAQLRELALNDYGCLEFSSACQDQQEIALSYWPDEHSIQRWKQAAEHRVAQRLGRESWYRDYRVDVAALQRRYGHNSDP